MTPFVPLLNFFLQLLVDDPLVLVETERVRSVQDVLGLSDLRGRGVRLVKGLRSFVQPAPDFGLARPWFGQPGHRGFGIQL